MASCARSKDVQDDAVGIYHAWSRCVQQLPIFGYDKASDCDFSYRRIWLESLIGYQTKVFAVDLGNFNILSNHFHLIVRNRPDLVQQWSDEMVAARWKLAWPTWNPKERIWERPVSDASIEQLLKNPDKLVLARKCLGSLSWFMARIKEPFSRLCNQDSGRTGAVWGERFGARRLLDENAVLTCMLYVDLNQVKAGMVNDIHSSQHSAISVRLSEREKANAQFAESEASVEAFERQRNLESCFTKENALQLIRGCNLAPIGEFQSSSEPLQLWRPQCVPGALDDATQRLTEGALHSDSNGIESLPTDAPLTGHDNASSEIAIGEESDSCQVELSENSPEAGLDSRGSSELHNEPSCSHSEVPLRKPKTYLIINRLFPNGLSQRASNRPIISLPLDYYLGLVQWSIERWKDPEAPPPPIVNRIVKSPDKWWHAIEQFEVPFFKAVGSEDGLREFAKSTGRAFVKGITACRAALQAPG